MLIPLKLATPFTALTVVVPTRVAPLGPLTIASVTGLRAVVTRLPLASRTSTSIAGEIAVPAVVLVGGCVEKTSWVGTAP